MDKNMFAKPILAFFKFPPEEIQAFNQFIKEHSVLISEDEDIVSAEILTQYIDMPEIEEGYVGVYHSKYSDPTSLYLVHQQIKEIITKQLNGSSITFHVDPGSVIKLK